MKRLFLLVVGCFTLVAASRSSSVPEQYLVRIELKTKSQIADLAKLGFDIAGVDLENGEFSVVTDTVGIKQLGKVKGIQTISSTFVFETLDSSYKKPEDVESELKEIEKNYPNLASVMSIGKSTDGRDIWAIRLTDRSVIPTDEKATVLFDGMHHAREVMTPEVGLDIAKYLTSNFASDKKVKEWMRMMEVWVVPMLNPDGNNEVWTANTMWRKNTRGGYGVDNNRNYPWAWGSCNGSSSNRNDDQYRGPSEGSEPETQALMDIAEQIKPVINVSLHSFSEIVIYPYGCPSQKLPPAQKAVIETVASELGKKLKRDSGSGTYTPGTSYDLLYPVDGGSIDWMFGKLGALGFVIEMNSQTNGFQPSFSRLRDSTVMRLRDGWQYILDRVLSSSIRVQADPGTLVRVDTDAGASVFEKKTDDKGWAHFIVQPGRYKVTDRSGKWGSQTVTVGSSTVAARLSR